MDIWGGENLEMSFRIWQCGGRIDIMPCSRVGHVFREHHPYKFPGGNPSATINHNLKRVAEVWMDDYKRLFYSRKPYVATMPTGDISSRKELRHRLQCKSFKWYLDNVYPDMFIPVRENVAGMGKVSNEMSHTCLDVTNPKVDKMKLRLVPCRGASQPMDATSTWYLWKQMAQLRIETEFSARCVDSSKRGENQPVAVYPCHGQRGNQEFRYTPKLQIVHVGTGACLTAHRKRVDGRAVWDPVVASCAYTINSTMASPLQRWTFSKWHDY
mmetsp:Transcript_29836/g.89225  ORF Transcript_29836/g.89225 Transcript_29836/m.89225 type:complete len:270 (+) Transcript_29836:64-873(+)